MVAMQVIHQFCTILKCDSTFEIKDDVLESNFVRYSDCNYTLQID